MNNDNVSNISDCRKKGANANADTVSEKKAPIKLSEKLRSGIPPGLRVQMRQQMRKKYEL